MTRRRRTVGMDDAMPRHSPAPRRHHAPDLARAAFAEKFGDVAVRHDETARNRVDDIEHPLRERRGLVGNHDDLVRRQAGINLVDPPDHATADVHGVSETGALHNR